MSCWSAANRGESSDEEERSDSGSSIGSFSAAIAGQAKTFSAFLKESDDEGYDEYDKVAHMRMGCGKHVADHEGHIKRLRQDLLNSYYWSGNMFTDYMFFCCNWHPWLGILLSHPNHPWDKYERAVSLIVSMTISMVPAVVISRQAPVIGLFEAKLLTVLLVTLPNLIIGLILYHMAIADTRCPKWTRLVNGCKHCVFCLAVVFALTMSSASYLIMSPALRAYFCSACSNLTSPLLFGPLILGQLFYAVLWFPIYFALPFKVLGGFLSVWRFEQKTEKQNAQQVHPLYPEATETAILLEA